MEKFTLQHLIKTKEFSSLLEEYTISKTPYIKELTELILNNLVHQDNLFKFYGSIISTRFDNDIYDKELKNLALFESKDLKIDYPHHKRQLAISTKIHDPQLKETVFLEVAKKLDLNLTGQRLISTSWAAISKDNSIIAHLIPDLLNPGEMVKIEPVSTYCLTFDTYCISTRYQIQEKNAQSFLTNFLNFILNKKPELIVFHKNDGRVMKIYCPSEESAHVLLNIFEYSLQNQQPHYIKLKGKQLTPVLDIIFQKNLLDFRLPQKAQPKKFTKI